MFPEAAAISAPVFGADGVIAAAIAVGGPTERLTPRINELRPIIADVAARASGREFEAPPRVADAPAPRRARKRAVAV
jgi:DNA-binding IclR family transcriptional regulator